MDSPSGTKIDPSSTAQKAPGGESSSSLRPGAKFSSNREIAVVQADYLALSNDLEQAQSLASSLELQLSGKTNELARFKLIWERTQTDLAKFAQDLETMRKERHTLANELQRAAAFEHKFEKLKAAHEELTARATRLESELVRERSAHVQSRIEVEELHAKWSGQPDGLAGGNPRDPALRRALEALRAQLDRVLSEPPVGGPAKPAAPEHIAIEFGA